MKTIAFEDEFNVSSGLFAVKFTAIWCGPCKKQQPNIDKMEEEFPDIKFLSVDVDDFPEIAKKYDIKSLPTLALIKDGNVVTKAVGVTLIGGLRTSFLGFMKS